MTPIEQEYLLSLARRNIQKYLTDGSVLMLEQDSIPSDSLRDKRGVFVTLTINDKLRGCIGNLESEQSIYQSVIDNSLAAAFFDPRFPSLTISELEKVKIEISILGPLKKLQFSTPEQFVNYLKQKKPGIFIKKNFNQATFLPQVWLELPEPEEFLQQLCFKAGLDIGSWKDLDLEIYEYEVEKIQEADSTPLEVQR
jgi:AmmeMemoRadiSam system protein A